MLQFIFFYKRQSVVPNPDMEKKVYVSKKYV